jgi:hypothetical protein
MNCDDTLLDPIILSPRFRERDGRQASTKSMIRNSFPQSSRLPSSSAGRRLYLRRDRRMSDRLFPSAEPRANDSRWSAPHFCVLCVMLCAEKLHQKHRWGRSTIS